MASLTIIRWPHLVAVPAKRASPAAPESLNPLTVKRARMTRVILSFGFSLLSTHFHFKTHLLSMRLCTLCRGLRDMQPKSFQVWSSNTMACSTASLFSLTSEAVSVSVSRSMTTCLDLFAYRCITTISPGNGALGNPSMTL